MRRYIFDIEEPIAFYNLKLKWMNKPFLKIIKLQVAKTVKFQILNQEKICERNKLRWI